MQINRIARAKQFLPFDALKGLQEALKEKELNMKKEKNYLKILYMNWIRYLIK